MKYMAMFVAGFFALSATFFALKFIGAALVALCAFAAGTLALFETGVLLQAPWLERKYSLLQRLRGAGAAQARGVLGGLVTDW